MANASSVTVQIISNRLGGQIQAEVKKISGDVIEKAARDVEAGAKGLVPVRTGRLRGSINTKLSPDRLAAIVGPNVFYGIFVERGGRRKGPRPYLLPSFERVMAGLTGRFTAAFRTLK